MRITMTGGSGMLGQEILKLDPTIDAPSRSQMDVTNLERLERELYYFHPDIVLHLAADTDCLMHNSQPERGITSNIIGTANIALVCLQSNIRLVYVSTDYVYQGPGPHKEDEPVRPPYNFGWSKLGGECSVIMVPNSLILRLSFGPRPFPWEKVYEGQVSSKLYVDEMAPLVLKMTKSGLIGIINLGGQRTSLENYARRTKPDIETIPCPDWVPKDTSLDLTKMDAILDYEKFLEGEKNS